VRRLRDVGEHAWLATLVRRLARVPGERRVLLGPGDDAAVVRVGDTRVVLTIDALVEGVHFRSRWLSPAALGRRAFAISASDVAAMGARPSWALLALEAPPRTAVAAVDAIVGGFAAAARRAGASLVGGNLSAGPHLALAAVVVGTVQGRIATRSGARPGDRLYGTGTLGGAGLAVRRLATGRAGRLASPPARLAAGERLAVVASAMIDVSDGLVQDLRHVCRASGVGAEVELARLPLAAACRRAFGRGAPAFAATAGEDYELLFTLPPTRVAALGRIVPRLGCRVTCIGRIVAGRPTVRTLDAQGRPARLGRHGFDHFR
jgi:thiamine-monophosphate kinase